MTGTARGIEPARGPLQGAVAVPGDKSIAHRALILGSLAEGTLRLRNLPDGADVRSTRRCVEALGARVADERGCLAVAGGLAGPARPSSGPGGSAEGAIPELDCGNSGTTMRLLMGVLAGRPGSVVLRGDASLSRRPMGRVAEPLRRMGARIRLGAQDRAPVSIEGRSPLSPIAYRLPVASAQVKSAVLLAALGADGESVVEDPFATRDHTERLLAWLGADIAVKDGAVRLRPGGLRSGRSLTIPGDASSAAYFLAAASLVEDSAVVVSRVGLNPGRLGFVDVLRRMGARLRSTDGGSNGNEPVGDLRASFADLRATRVAAAEVPALVDEVPLLAVLASQAEGTSRIEGLAELRLKESDRLGATAAGLRAMGGRARVEGDALVVEGPCRLRGAAVETLGDHRLAMAFAVAALVAKGRTRLSDAACAAISYPAFFDDLDSLRT